MDNFYELRDTARNPKEIGRHLIDIWPSLFASNDQIAPKIIRTDDFRFVISYVYLDNILPGSTILNFSGTEKGWLVEFNFNIDATEYDQIKEQFNVIELFQDTGIDIFSYNVNTNTQNEQFKIVRIRAFLNEDEWKGLKESWTNQLVYREMVKTEKIKVPDFEE